MRGGPAEQMNIRGGGVGGGMLVVAAAAVRGVGACL
jgi:hypothetical protein